MLKLRLLVLWALLAAVGRGEELKPYEQVIPKTARSSAGVFVVHMVKDKLYYEIPKKQLDRPFLLVTQVARTRIGAGYGGDQVDQRVVRWDLRDQKVYLRSISFDIVADPNSPVARAVEAANEDSILQSFPVETLSSKGDPVIDVSKLFTTDVAELSPKGLLRARYFEGSRSYLERARAYPRNVEVESTVTFTNPPEAGGPPPSNTVVMHFSMVALPDQPMRPRLYDDRVGFFTVGQVNFSRSDQKVRRRRFLCRWRLEKKHPEQALSEPIQPIVFFVDPATPPQWVPYVKRGIEEWQKAFEAAGFKDAIVARDAPDDPDWSAEDARYSTIRWLTSPVENAFGPNISDPRSGEILEADIALHHNITALLRTWYYLQASPLDPRARRLPLPDSLMGELIQFVVAHEVGHSLGFPHNMKASSTYPARKLRDKAWLAKMGHCPSIMDYSRLNYVAQPEDKIPPSLLIPKVGPYDCWAAHWGYAPIPEAANEDDEEVTLDRWAREQDKTPWFRFSAPGMMGIDPGDQSEAVGDEDAIWSTGWGLKNLQRVARTLITANGHPGEDWSDLADMYERLLGQWTQELYHVVVLVGGTPVRNRHGGQNGLLFTAVPRERQRAAVRFVLENGLKAPAWLMDRDVIRRIEPSGSFKRLLRYQQGILKNLLLATRLLRMLEQQELGPRSGYSAPEFLQDVRAGLFEELRKPGPVRIGGARRGIQSAYVDALEGLLKIDGDDLHGLVLMELAGLRGEVKAALARTQDPVVKAHLLTMQESVRDLLEPQRGPAGGKRAIQAAAEETREPGCWEPFRP